MSSIKESIKEFFLKRKLEKAIKGNSAERYSVPFARAKSVGIYFNTDNAKYSKQINEFVKGLKKEGKQVEAVTYLNDSQDNPYDFSYHVLKDENINLFGEIQAEKIHQFIDTPFDYLFCISDDLNLPVKYMLAASKAKCRVGLHSENNEPLFDFMMSGSKKGDLQEFIRNILRYTSHIAKEMA